MDKLEIGIVDTRNIIRSVKETYGYDFSDYALTSFKRRLVKAMNQQNSEDTDLFIQNLIDDKDYFERFLFNISVETTEMFRDPSLWRILRDEFIPKLVKDSDKPRIWIAGDSSGEELFSLAILLKESNLLNNVEIFMTYSNDIQLKLIEKGQFSTNKVEINDANYKRFNGKNELSDYYSTKTNESYWDTSLIKNVKFIKQNIIFDDSPRRIRLALFRNKMIYYNQILQDEILKRINRGLIPGSFLIVGDKESLQNCVLCDDYILAYKEESIYKKKALN